MYAVICRADALNAGQKILGHFFKEGSKRACGSSGGKQSLPPMDVSNNISAVVA